VSLVVSSHLRIRYTSDFLAGVNGEVSYSLSGYGTEQTAPEFSIDARGDVRVAVPLDCERRATYHLLVTATDNGRPRLLTTAHLFVTGNIK
jgi:hypothetical protein